MKKIGLLLIFLLGIVACTPTSEDNTLPTRVILPTDAENATEAVIDPLETATESVIDPLESVTESVIDPLESVTESVIDPLESVTESVIDPLESVTESVIDPLTGLPTPIVIPALQQTQPPTPTSSSGLNVIMPTLDLTNLPTSVPTPTPYPVVEDFSTLRESTQIVRLRGTVEIFIDPVREDDIFLLRDANNVAIELLWDVETIDTIPNREQVIDAIGIIRTSLYGHSDFLMDTVSIIPITPTE